MTSKAKTLLKVGIPLVIVIQLISITFLLAKISKDKAPKLGFVPLKGDILEKSRAAVERIGK